jgi:hypothetical protein
MKHKKLNLENLFLSISQERDCIIDFSFRTCDLQQMCKKFKRRYVGFTQVNKKHTPLYRSPLRPEYLTVIENDYKVLYTKNQLKPALNRAKKLWEREQQLLKSIETETKVDTSCMTKQELTLYKYQKKQAKASASGGSVCTFTPLHYLPSSDSGEFDDIEYCIKGKKIYFNFKIFKNKFLLQSKLYKLINILTKPHRESFINLEDMLLVIQHIPKNYSSILCERICTIIKSHNSELQEELKFLSSLL